MKLFLLTIEKLVSFLYYKSNWTDYKAVSGTKRQFYQNKVLESNNHYTATY